MQRWGARCAAFVVAGAIGVCSVQATTPAFDSAADPAYDDGWQSGDNGGFGFDPWLLVTNAGGPTAGHLVATSTGNGDGLDNGNVGGVAGDGDIDTAGRAWGMFANSGDGAGAIRGFDLLGVGAHAIIEMDNGFIGPGPGQVIVELETTTGDRLSVTYIGTAATYHVSDSSGAGGSSVGYTDEGLTIDWLITSPTTYSVTLTRNDGVSSSHAGNYTGQPFGFIVSSSNTGFNASNNFYVNRMTVTPEPAGLALVALVGGALVTRRRR